MKGQFFLISGCVVIVVLLLIKSSLNLSQIIENKRSLEISMERKEFLNIKEQIYRAIDYSCNKNESENIEKYLKYVKNRLKGRTLELEGMVIEAFYNTTEPEGILNLVILNLLGEKILSLNLSFNDSEKYFSGLEDGSTLYTNFTFTISSNQNYNLCLNYSTLKQKKDYSILIPVELNKSKLVAFFDLKFIGLRGEISEEFSRIVEIE